MQDYANRYIWTTSRTVHYGGEHGKGACGKRFGVNLDSAHTFEKHISEKVNQTNRIVGLIDRTFVSLDDVILQPQFTALVRPITEYASPVWNKYKMKDITTIKNVQRRASKLIPSLKDLPYSKKLTRLNLPILAFRRSRTEMIESYKIVKGVYDEEVCKGTFTLQEEDHTRGHRKIYKLSSRLIKNFFCNHVVENLNNLSENVVVVGNMKFEREQSGTKD